jgi:putative transposase
MAYCLLPTHYHIVAQIRQILAEQASMNQNVEHPEIPESKAVSLAMQKLGISYTKAVNQRYGRVGALFQGQFRGKPIQHSNHLLSLCVYVHANPVKDGLVALPEDWEFSNYLEWMNLRAGTLVNREFITDNFGTPEAYRQLTLEYLRTKRLPDEVRGYLQGLED